MTADLHRRTQRIFVWLALIPVLLCVVAYWASYDYRQRVQAVEHTRLVLDDIDALSINVLGAESNARGFLLTADQTYLPRFENRIQQLQSTFQDMQRIVSDNPQQQVRVQSLSTILSAKVAELNRAIALRKSAGLPQALAAIEEDHGQELVRQSLLFLGEMTTAEQALLRQRLAAQRLMETAAALSFGAGLLATIALLFFANRQISSYAVERNRAESEVRRLNQDLELRIEKRTADLAHANDRLQRSNEDLQRFAYVASHDLQEPLRMIASYVTLLGRRYQGRLDPQADEFIGFATTGAKRMQSMIDDLLSYSRVGGQELKVQDTDLCAIMDDVKNRLQASIQATNASIECEPLPTLPVDALKMSQVFQNLIANSLKFHRPGVPPRIRLSAHTQGNEAIVVIEDNGIGLDPKYAERIFIMFQRLHAAHEYEGTGIGLAICKRLVELHGGRIWVESAPDQGAKFYIALPAHGKVSSATA